MTILKVASEKHVLLFTMHHVVSDAWSTGVLIRELSELYQSFVAGHGSSLEPLAIQYADYAAWQRRWLEGEVLQKQLAYWANQLEGAPDGLNLPLDRPRGSDVTYNGARAEFMLPARLVTALAALARHEGTTLFVTLLAGFQALLARYTGQDDSVVGTPIAGRNGAETEPLIGFFVNTLVLRSRVNPTATFRGFLGEVRETVLEATAHQDIPFERLVDELQPTRGAGRTPLFQVAFVFQNTPREALAMSQLALRNRPVETLTTKFDWSLSLVEAGQQVVGHFEYNTDLFDAETIRQVIEHYENLLAAAVEAPDGVLSQLDMLSVKERQRQLVEWNDTAREYPGEQSIQALFEEQVERGPDRVAVILDGHQVTYRMLNARANQLAHHLRSLGVGPEVLVGLYMERSIELVVGILGILKSGGCVCSAGSGPAVRAADVHGRRRGTGGDRDRGSPRGQTSRDQGPPAQPRQRVGCDRSRTGECTCRRHECRQRRVRDLHVGVDRYAERHTGYAPQCGPSVRRDRCLVRLRGGRRLVALPLVCLRFFGLGAVGGPLLRRAAGGRPVLWSHARRRSSSICWRGSRSPS